MSNCPKLDKVLTQVTVLLGHIVQNGGWACALWPLPVPMHLARPLNGVYSVWTCIVYVCECDNGLTIAIHNPS